MDGVAIRCRNIIKDYGVTRAVELDSLEFCKGLVYALIGPNGAGKTTLVNILTGFVKPDSGDCYIDNYRITGLAPYEIARKGITRTFQELRLISQVSVIDNVLLALSVTNDEKLVNCFRLCERRREEKQRLEQAMGFLEIVGLISQASMLSGELSYGQQKLLSLACCIATDSPIIILDEPVAGIQPSTTDKILELIVDLRNSERTIIFIEHNLDAVVSVAQVVVVMNQGQLIGIGPPQEVLARDEVAEAYLA